MTNMNTKTDLRDQTAWFLVDQVHPKYKADMLLYEVFTTDEDGLQKRFPIEDGVACLPDEARMTPKNKTRMGRFLYTSIDPTDKTILKLVKGKKVIIIPAKKG